MADEQEKLQAIIKKFNEQFYKDKQPECLQCKTSENVIPCVFGRPTKELSLYAQEGYVALMGCCILTDDGKQLRAKCKKCKTNIYDV